MAWYVCGLAKALHVAENFAIGKMKNMPKDYNDKRSEARKINGNIYIYL